MDTVPANTQVTENATEQSQPNRSIQILAPRLANQIAAGEVVERPASVVKELVENALDAGATKLEIEIERGGHKLIRVRDNGCGIAKEQLELALSRHATSKITTLDDLEAISSLGFRGEALASVSSVSRLTLTSKTIAQNEAWQCYAEGRDMAVVIRPAAHPVGTSVEVSDLFFNTPARRKFMRTEKTEFNHIDELLKRIALSRFAISFILKHNGKIVRQYRPALDLAGQERRLASIFNRLFVDSSMYLECEHNDLKISGWLCLPQAARSQSDWQYCYVNGRMMRDKLINHAIRQAYADSISSPLFPSFLLFITLPASEVDVNVHPAKHEVRFHQSRLVHDYIVQVLTQALTEGQQNQANQLHSEVTQSVVHDEPTVSQPPNFEHKETPSSVAPSFEPTSQFESKSAERHNYSNVTAQIPEGLQNQNARSQPSHVSNSPAAYNASANSAQQISSYHHFLEASAAAPLPDENLSSMHDTSTLSDGGAEKLAIAFGGIWGKILSFQGKDLLLIENKGQLFWLSLSRLWHELTVAQLYQQWLQAEVISAPLLLPVRLSAENLFDIPLWQAGLSRLGFHVKQSPNGALIVTQLPSLLRSAVVSELFDVMAEKLNQCQASEALALAQGLMDAEQVLALLKGITKALAQNQEFDLGKIKQLLDTAAQHFVTQESKLMIENDTLLEFSFIRAFNTDGVSALFRS